MLLGGYREGRAVGASQSFLWFYIASYAANLGSATREYKFVSEGELKRLMTLAAGQSLYIEEKVDGANMGISISEEGQNYNINTPSRFAGVTKWSIY